MAESENNQLVREIVADLNARRLDAYLQKLDEAYAGESELAPGPVRGREGVTAGELTDILYQSDREYNSAGGPSKYHSYLEQLGIQYPTVK